MDNDFTILLAEDEMDDVFFLKSALAAANIFNPVNVVRDGEEAIQYLQGEDKFADRALFPLPKVALLDVKMPKQTGLEVLAWIRHNENEGLKRLPVIIMSNSNLQEDIDLAYQLGVNAYLIKPRAFAELVKVLKKTTEFWRDTAAHPEI